MIRKFFFIVCLVLVTTGASFVAAGDIQAADCKALHDQIHKERTLMKRKELALAAIKACPNDAPIIYQYGYTMERLRKYEDALEQYKKSVKLDPSYAKAYFSVGDIQMLLRNYREAVVAYQIGLQYENDDRAKISLKEARAKYKEVTGKEAPAPPPPLNNKVAVKAKSPVVSTPVPVQTGAKKDVATAAKKEIPVSVAEAPLVRLQVPFYKKSTVLSQDARDVIAVVVGQAMSRPDMKDIKVEISGHTDNIGDPSQNDEISKKRAEVVKAYLTENFGISSDRLVIAYHGQKLPRVPNTSPANQELNRRVEFSKVK